MAFIVEPTRAPVAIGNIVITLKDAVGKIDPLSGDSPAYQSAHFQIEIMMSDGTTVLRRGDLVPHLEPAEIQGLLNFMEILRARAETQILGV